MGTHCQGHNVHSIGIAYIGGTNAKGRPRKTITPEREASLVLLCKQLAERFPALREEAKPPVSSSPAAVSSPSAVSGFLVSRGAAAGENSLQETRN